MPQFPSVIELSSLDGKNGFQINGEAAGDQIALSFHAAGDLNGDGFADVIIGATRAGAGGAAYVVFGHAGGFASALELSALNGGNGFQIVNESAGDNLGFSVSGAGDINGDGFDDLIAGARAVDANGAQSGASYVIFGRSTGFPANFNPSTLNGANGFQINGALAGEYAGHAVSAAGDVNHDGIDDLIVGAPFSNSGGNFSGAAYAVFGMTAGFSSTLELSALNGANGFRMVGAAVNELDGVSVATIGDLNGDGIDDVIVGGSSADHNGYNSGSSYVVFGRSGPFASSLDLSALNGVDGFRIDGAGVGELSGFPVSSAGDINGDGIADLVIGASGAHPNGGGSGATYVLFGKNAAFDPVFQLSNIDGTNGFVIAGEAAGDFSGYGAAGAGDINGDGFSDIIIGAKGSDKNASYAGASYVLFGTASGFPSQVELSSLDGANGFRIDGELASDASGCCVSAAGDVNGDGLADLAIGAQLADPHGSFSGAAYIVFARQPAEAVDRTGTNADQTLAGGGFNDTLSGLAGEDQLWGNGGNDTLAGGIGNDTIRGGAGNDTFDETDVAFDDHDQLIGGAGADVYRLNSFLVAYTPLVIEAANQGRDTVVIFDLIALSNVTYVLPANVENLRYTGTSPFIGRGNLLDNQLTGAAGNDRFVADSGGADTFNGGAGSDTMDFRVSTSAVAVNLTTGVNGGAAGGDVFQAMESLWGSAKADAFVGNAAGNNLLGFAGNDTLSGAGGSDTLNGGAGDDLLVGGGGADQLTGAEGADRFDYNAIGESTLTAAARDVILGFDSKAADLIDVSGIDAIAGGGTANDKFDFIGSNPFTNLGQLHVLQIGGNTFVEANVTGDTAADFRIELKGTIALDQLDFVL